MKTLAILDPTLATSLTDFLKSQQIPFSTQPETDAETGLESINISVVDELYDRACDATEKWDQSMHSQPKPRCPHCGSSNLEYQELAPGESVTQISGLYHCTDCARPFPAQR